MWVKLAAAGAIAIPILIVLAIVLLVLFIAFKRSYRVAAPNEAIVITGRAPSKKGDVDLKSASRVVVGGRAIVRPLLDRAHVVTLSSRQIQVEVDGYSQNNIRLYLRGVAQIKIGEGVDDVRKAAQRFLDQQKLIDEYSQEILSGTLRAVVGTLTVEQVLRDRATFAAQVQEDAANSMNNQGLVIDTFQIVSVESDGDYLVNLGRPEAALVAKVAAIAESASVREATEASNQDQQKIIESQKELELRQAAIQEETAAVKAAAAAADQLAQAEQRQRILDEQQKVADRENDLTERRLIGEVQKPADASKYAAEREADAQHYARERASNAALTEAQNAARAVEAAGTAEARAIAEKGKAEAATVQASAEAYKQFNEAAVLAQILETLPKVAHELAAPYGNIESLSVISSDGESKIGKNLSVGLSQTLDMIKSTTGIDLQDLIGEALKSEPAAVAAPATSTAPTEAAPTE